MKPSAFTLLELTVALAIGAMLTAIAVFSFRGPYRAAQLAAAVEQLELFDQQLRSHAIRTGRSAELTIDLSTGTLSADEPQRGQPTRRLVLTSGLRIDRVELTDKRVSQGKARCHCWLASSESGSPIARRKAAHGRRLGSPQTHPNSSRVLGLTASTPRTAGKPAVAPGTFGVRLEA